MSAHSNQHWRLLSGFPKKKLNKISDNLLASEKKRIVPQRESDLFTPAECRRILDAATNLSATNGTAGDIIRSERDSTIKWIMPCAENDWIFSRLEKLVRKTNLLYKFELAGFLEPLQLGRYESSGLYDWHMDHDGFPHRKMTISVQLSHENDYQGGSLEFMDGPNIRQAPRTQGSAVVFPSYFLHRVTPVTEGVRCSLVVWIGGMPYK